MPEEIFAAEVAANQANWEARAMLHAKFSFYNVDRYVAEPELISGVVEWDRRILGDVKGLDMLHLQCHIGTDSLSWARLGARVTGLDFSRESLRAAEELCRRAGAEVTFVQGDVRRAHQLLKRQFDIVYTSVGVLCWLPDIYAWAEAVAACVRPGGRFYIRGGHPLISTFEYGRDDTLLVCRSHYFTDGGWTGSYFRGW